MTARTAPGGAHVGSLRSGGALATSAFWLAAAVSALGIVTGAIFGTTLAIGGQDAVSDNWIGWIGVVGLLGGLAGAFVAFLLAVAARLRLEHATRLWLPLLLFPALLAFVVLGEAFWWE
jgi:hypothetical protein